MKVSFNSKVDEGLRIQQLSGGQKSLVALALGAYLHKRLCFAISFYSQFSPFKNVILRHFICSMRCVGVELAVRDIFSDGCGEDRRQFRCSVSDCRRR